MLALDERTTVTADWLRQELGRFRSTDDVFCDDFLKGIIFVGAEDDAEIQIAPDARQMLEDMGTSWIETLNGMYESEEFKPGPYVVLQHELLEIFRLHDDVQSAFMSSVILHDRA